MFGRDRRRQVISDYTFPHGLRTRFAQERPDLSPEDQELAFDGLRDWFLLCRDRRQAGQFLSMPSAVVDDAWHTFILFTRDYLESCRRAFGGYLHHTPKEGMGASGTSALAAGMIDTFVTACRLDGVDPRGPDRLPRIFAIDARLGAPDGFTYNLSALAAAAATRLDFPTYEGAAAPGVARGKDARGQSGGCAEGGAGCGGGGGGDGGGGAGCGGGGGCGGG